VRLLSVVLGVVLGAGLLFMATTAEARADSGGEPDVSAQAMDAGVPAGMLGGTDAEAAEYERRQASSPEVAEFSGGDVVVVGGGFILLVILVVIIVILLDKP
jgi:hypothetical protein